MNDKNETRRQLPDGWRWAKLGEVCLRISNGTSANQNQEKKGLPVTRIETISTGEINSERVGYIDATTEEFERYVLGRGDIIFSHINSFERLGNCALYKGEPSTLIHGMNLLRLEVDLNANSDFLLAFLRSKDARAFYDENARRAIGQASLNTKDLSTMQIPLPPLDEQKRIAAILGEQLNAVQKARDAARAQLDAVRALPSAYLRQVFNSPEAETWQRKKLGEAAKIQSGYAFKTDWYTADGIRLLRNANIFQGFVDWSDSVNLSFEQRPNFAAYELQENDVVLSLDRPLVSNGLKIAKLTADDVPSLLLQRVGRFQTKNNLDTDYLFAFLNSENFIQEIKGHDQSLGVPHISPGQVEAIEIPFPPIEEQKQIAERLAAQMQAVETARKSLAEQLAAIERLPAKLLSRAFAGEL